MFRNRRNKLAEKAKWEKVWKDLIKKALNSKIEKIKTQLLITPAAELQPIRCGRRFRYRTIASKPKQLTKVTNTLIKELKGIVCVYNRDIALLKQERKRHTDISIQFGQDYQNALSFIRNGNKLSDDNAPQLPRMPVVGEYGLSYAEVATFKSMKTVFENQIERLQETYVCYPIIY